MYTIVDRYAMKERLGASLVKIELAVLVCVFLHACLLISKLQKRKVLLASRQYFQVLKQLVRKSPTSIQTIFRSFKTTC
jgi:hypothetical protein